MSNEADQRSYQLLHTLLHTQPYQVIWYCICYSNAVCQPRRAHLHTSVADHLRLEYCCPRCPAATHIRPLLRTGSEWCTRCRMVLQWHSIATAPALSRIGSAVPFAVADQAFSVHSASRLASLSGRRARMRPWWLMWRPWRQITREVKDLKS